VTQQTPQPVLCLVGPTASGKTAAALQLASKPGSAAKPWNSSAWTRRWSIAAWTSAPPSPADERAQAVHHLLDILDPAQSYSAAQFAADARRLIQEIRQRGAQP
jgi:tRNA delta(2)-isopentenylpyrophosphate transferase